MKAKTTKKIPRKTPGTTNNEKHEENKEKNSLGYISTFKESS